MNFDEKFDAPTDDPTFATTATPKSTTRGRFPMRKDPANAGLKFNSTNTVHLDHTIARQSASSTVRSVARAILANFGEANPSGPLHKAFSEEFTPFSSSWSSSVVQKPTVTVIDKFLRSLLKAAQLDPETIIVALIYIERLTVMTGDHLGPTTWRPITAIAMIIAAKVWNDLAVWIVDFEAAIPKISRPQLAMLEGRMLQLLKFHVVVTAQSYAKYYFELRAIADAQPIRVANKDKNKGVMEKTKARMSKTASLTGDALLHSEK